MKAVFIAFEQSLQERVLAIMSRKNIRGYTLWQEVHGVGSKTGDPHLGSHAWSQLNTSLLTIVEDEKIESFMEDLKELDRKKPLLGVRAFVWNIEGGM